MIRVSSERATALATDPGYSVPLENVVLSQGIIAHPNGVIQAADKRVEPQDAVQVNVPAPEMTEAFTQGRTLFRRWEKTQIAKQ